VQCKDEASLIFAGFKGFKVVTARKNTTCAAAPNGFCDAAEHTASLIAGAETEWRVLEMSEAREYLTDAVEDLWERVLCRTGELRGESSLCVRKGRIGLTGV
jgi:hypothetical protein